MKLRSVFDAEFKKYGQVLNTFELTELFAVLSKKPVPADGIFYTPSDADLESCAVLDDLKNRGFGGMPIQIGYVSAKNGILNCLEYHKSS